jgi:hypothetical protein
MHRALNRSARRSQWASVPRGLIRNDMELLPSGRGGQPSYSRSSGRKGFSTFTRS